MAPAGPRLAPAPPFESSLSPVGPHRCTKTTCAGADEDVQKKHRTKRRAKNKIFFFRWRMLVPLKMPSSIGIRQESEEGKRKFLLLYSNWVDVAEEAEAVDAWCEEHNHPSEKQESSEKPKCGVVSISRALLSICQIKRIRRLSSNQGLPFSHIFNAITHFSLCLCHCVYRRRRRSPASSADCYWFQMDEAEVTQ